MEQKIYYTLAYYLFSKINNPLLEVKLHKNFFKDKDVSSRIYISEEGINGQFSGLDKDAEAYMHWLRERPDFVNVKFKIHTTKCNIFPRKTVKYKKQLVALHYPVDISKTGKHISPQEWKQMLLKKKALVIDVRNNYESKIGHFEGAILPDLNTFKEFPSFAEKLAKQVNPATTPIMMYCTGGIRCEIYSALMKEKGFEEIYQLDGGVIAYGQQVGQELWKGKLFVFDDRLAVPIDEKNLVVESITTCCFCQQSSDTYFNCANTDCNNLFISCDSCIVNQKGCCSDHCLHAPRRRTFDIQKGNTPFRKKHLEKFIH